MTTSRSRPSYDPAGTVLEHCRSLVRMDTTNFGDDSGPGERKAAEYVAEDLASPIAGKIAHSFRHSGEAFDGAKERLREFRRETLTAVAGVAGFGFGLFSLVEHAKEANVELLETQRAIAGTLSTVLKWDAGTDAVDKFTRATRLARGVVEELEETAKLHLLLQGLKVRLLSDAQVKEVEEAFPS